MAAVTKPDERVTVVVRVRPPNNSEKGKEVIIRPAGDNMLVFDPVSDISTSNKKNFRRFTPGERRKRNTTYAFDRVFSGSSSNQEVFDSTCKPIVDACLQGINCCCFAFGATGAGKTHTMLGVPTDPGCAPRTVRALFEEIEKRNADTQFVVQLQYVEVYNETLRDLLHRPGVELASASDREQEIAESLVNHGQPVEDDDSKNESAPESAAAASSCPSAGAPSPFVRSDPLPLREDPEMGMVVAGLSVHVPSSADEVLRLLHLGSQNRTQCPTDRNSESSRSHAVMRLTVRQRPRGGGADNVTLLRSNLCMVDLAGSERAAASNNRGALLVEGANINRSLLALGNCINALASKQKRAYVPFRDSKLTRLLRDGLEGNCKTVMIAAISPSVMCIEDTGNTLKYANRAKKIQTKAVRNVQTVQFHVSRYQAIIKELQQQIKNLKTQGGSSNSSNDSSDHERSVARNRVLRFVEDRTRMTRDLVDTRFQELQETVSRAHHQQRLNLWDAFVEAKRPAMSPDNVRSLRRHIEQSEETKEQLRQRRAKLEKGLLQNAEQTQTLLKQELPQSLKDSTFCELLELETLLRFEQVRITEMKRHMEMQEEIVQHESQRALGLSDMLDNVLGIVAQQHRELERSGALNSPLRRAFSQAQQLSKQARLPGVAKFNSSLTSPSGPSGGRLPVGGGGAGASAHTSPASFVHLSPPKMVLPALNESDSPATSASEMASPISQSESSLGESPVSSPEAPMVLPMVPPPPAEPVGNSASALKTLPTDSNVVPLFTPVKVGSLAARFRTENHHSLLSSLPENDEKDVDVISLTSTCDKKSLASSRSSLASESTVADEDQRPVTAIASNQAVLPKTVLKAKKPQESRSGGLLRRKTKRKGSKVTKSVRSSISQARKSLQARVAHRRPSKNVTKSAIALPALNLRLALDSSEDNRRDSGSQSSRSVASGKLARRKIRRGSVTASSSGGKILSARRSSSSSMKKGSSKKNVIKRMPLETRTANATANRKRHLENVKLGIRRRRQTTKSSNENAPPRANAWQSN